MLVDLGLEQTLECLGAAHNGETLIAKLSCRMLLASAVDCGLYNDSDSDSAEAE
jgi:hypothetical protein